MDVENYRAKKANYNKTYMPQYRKERNAILLSLHRCVKCGKSDEYTLSGRHQCKECCDKAKAYRSGVRVEKQPSMTDEEFTEHRRAYQREYMRDLRAFRKGQHQCTECGKQDALTLNGHRLCQSCWERKYKRPYIPQELARMETEDMIVEPKMTRDERKERADAGFCYLCGAPVKQGTSDWSGKPFRLCEQCYDKLKQAGDKGREAYLAKYRKTWGQYRYEWDNVRKIGWLKRNLGKIPGSCEKVW